MVEKSKLIVLVGCSDDRITAAYDAHLEKLRAENLDAYIAPVRIFGGAGDHETVVKMIQHAVRVAEQEEIGNVVVILSSHHDCKMGYHYVDLTESYYLALNTVDPDASTLATNVVVSIETPLWFRLETFENTCEWICREVGVSAIC